jgi:hypothetical protein
MAAAWHGHNNRPGLQLRVRHRVLAFRFRRLVGDYLAVVQPRLGRVQQRGIVEWQDLLWLAGHYWPGHGAQPRLFAVGRRGYRFSAWRPASAAKRQ